MTGRTRLIRIMRKADQTAMALAGETCNLCRGVGISGVAKRVMDVTVMGICRGCSGFGRAHRATLETYGKIHAPDGAYDSMRTLCGAVQQRPLWKIGEISLVLVQEGERPTCGKCLENIRRHNTRPRRWY